MTERSTCDDSQTGIFIAVHEDNNIQVYISNMFSQNEDNFNDKITTFGNAELIRQVQLKKIDR